MPSGKGPGRREAGPAAPRRAARLLLALTGAAALALGLAQGGYQTTMAKAVRICMECIGIG